MVNSYYTQNLFFDDIIREYLDNDKREWVRHERPTDKTTLVDMDYNYYLDGQIPACKIMSQMEGLGILGNKRNLYLTMKKHKPTSIGDYIPKTYMLDPRDTENLRGIFDGRKYIAKPGDLACREGIFVTDNYEDMCNRVNRTVYEDWIIQEFVEDPLLYEGKKFHIRPYVFLVKRNTSFDVYVYNECQMYFSGVKYDTNNPESWLSHGGREYDKRVFPRDFQDYYGDENIAYVYDQIHKIVDETTKPLFSVISKTKGDAYKLIAYDILIDKDYKCHLAEVNRKCIGMDFHGESFNRLLYEQLLNTFFYPRHKTKTNRVHFIRNQNSKKKARTIKSQRTPRKPPKTQKRKKRTHKLSRK